MPRPLFDVAYIRAFATRIGATTNSAVVLFIDQLEAQLNEDNQNNSFGVNMLPPNIETPVIMAAVAEVIRADEVAQDATDHAEGVEPPINTDTSTTTSGTATGTTTPPEDCGPALTGTLHTPHAQTKGHK